MSEVEVERNRIEPVRRRVAVAKAVLAIGAAAAFGGALALSRQHSPGHPKGRLRPLGVLPGYVTAVRRNLGIHAGVIEPPVASPSAATHVS